MRKTRTKATDIYTKQNKALHKLFAAKALPYKENKDVWTSLFSDVVNREVAGLSDLTLGERHKVIAHFQSQGHKLFAPAVPMEMRAWKKGDTEIECERRKADDRQIRMVEAMWAEMGYEPKTLRGLCRKLFGTEEPLWLDQAQKRHLVNVVKKKAGEKGFGNYFSK